MKTILKHSKLLTVFAMAAAASITAVSAVAMQHRGTDILHFAIKKAMAADATLAPDAVGRVDLRQNHQGKVTVKNLDVTVKNLTPLVGYQLVIPGDPLALPPVAPVVVADFTTDRRGNAALHFRKIEHEDGNGVYQGRGKLPLPAVVDPLTGVKHLAVVGTNDVNKNILTADLTAPDRLTYLVKRDISTDTIRASLQVVANSRVAWLRVRAYGLTASTSYNLVLNGAVPGEAFTTDERGRLLINSQLEHPLDVLTLSKVQVGIYDDTVTPATFTEVLAADLP